MDVAGSLLDSSNIIRIEFKFSCKNTEILTQPRRETDTSCPQWKFQNSNFIIFAWNLVWLNTIEEEIFMFPGCGKGLNKVENLQLILTILFYRLLILRLFQRLFLVNSQENQQKFKFPFPLPAARNWENFFFYGMFRY